jgi:hypothetical protein
MMHSLLAMLEVPSVSHQEAAAWRSHGISDFDDALQMASAVAGQPDLLITRTVNDFQGCIIHVMTTEEFLAAYP